MTAAAAALLLAALVLLTAGCNDKRVDIDPLLKTTGGNTAQGDTAYAEINPPWFGFQSPRAVLVGNDNLIYVADYDANEVVMMDASGAVLQRRSVPHPVALAQNSTLDLYVCGEMPAPNSVDTIGAVYRISLVRFDTTYLASIRVDTSQSGEIDTTFFYRDTSFFYNHALESAPMRAVWKEPGRPERRFVGVGVLPDNRYLVARTGENNSSFVDPDTRLLLFNAGDTLITAVPDLVTRASGGTAITDIQQLTSVFVIPSRSDIVVTQNGSLVAYAAIWMTYSFTPDFQGWLPKFDPAIESQRGIEFVRPYRYTLPTGVAYDRRRRELFIVDAALDSIAKFTERGAYKVESFGKALTMRQSGMPLNRPMSIAFSGDCILYVADMGNHAIRRFRLANQSSCF